LLTTVPQVKLLHCLTGEGPGVARWLRRFATSRMVPGSIPGGVIGFFSDISPSDRSVALGSTQPLVQMSTRNIPGGKGGRCVRLTSPLLRAECHEIWGPKLPGTLWATPCLLRDSFTLPYRCPVTRGAASWERFLSTIKINAHPYQLPSRRNSKSLAPRIHTPERLA
jgi:hypothetical protein